MIWNEFVCVAPTPHTNKVQRHFWVGSSFIFLCENSNEKRKLVRKSTSTHSLWVGSLFVWEWEHPVFFFWQVEKILDHVSILPSTYDIVRLIFLPSKFSREKFSTIVLFPYLPPQIHHCKRVHNFVCFFSGIIIISNPCDWYISFNFAGHGSCVYPGR